MNNDYWDGAMMRLVDEDGSWNDLRINKDNIGKAFLLKFTNVGVPEDLDAPNYQRIAILRSIGDKSCIFDELYIDSDNDTKTCRHAIYKVYRKTGERIAFASILTDEPIYQFGNDGIRVYEQNSDGYMELVKNYSSEPVIFTIKDPLDNEGKDDTDE
jgi:hypothetical protein